MMTTAKLHNNTFVDDVAFEPKYLQALLTAAGRSVATLTLSHFIE